jgi:hypothetical protein
VNIHEVARLPPLDRFFYWIRERHAIHLRKQRGESKPWTDDEVLRRYWFTNPYREHDKVTAWFREAVRDPLRNDPAVLFATAAFRWFNWPPTGQILLDAGLLARWREKEVVRRLTRAWAGGAGKVFTGAYMIKAGSGPPGSKIAAVCAAVTNVWKARDRLVQVCQDDCRLEALWRELKQFPFLGGFMSYEVVTDLRHTALLENATDINTWANPGPGALRGLLRLEGGVPGRGREDASRRVKDPIPKMVDLLGLARKRLSGMPPPELRDIEHSLCEVDKMERALDLHVRGIDSGRLKRRYEGA